jgi:predicted MFS family arabinose efflux permease
MKRETGTVRTETGNRTILIVSTLFGVLFLATVDNQLLIPLLPLLGREFGVSMATTLAWLFSGYALAAAVFSLFLGPLIDRFGRLMFLRLGLIFAVFIAICTYFSKEYYQLFGLRVAAGLAGGLLSTCTASLVGDLFSYQRRGRIMGFVLSSYFAALILGIPLAAWTAEMWSWRTIYLILSLLGLLLAGCTFFFPPIQAQPSPALSLGSYLRTYPRLLRKGDVRAAVVTSFGVSGATLAFLTFIPDYLNGQFGLQPVQISWLFVTAGVAAALASPVSGWLSDRFTKKKVFLVANTLLALPLLALNQLPWGGRLFGIFFLISLCVSFRQTALQTLQTELVLTERRGSFIALRNGCSQLGIAVSVLVSGTLYSTMGYGGVTAWAALLTLLSSLIFYWAVQEPGKTE